ncbi:hypothetical protein KQI52_03175 [bacterium]|nr:hypothetical protein [bacterium]
MDVSPPTTHTTEARRDFAPESRLHEVFPAWIAGMIRLASSAAASFTTDGLHFMSGVFGNSPEARLVRIPVTSERDRYDRYR